MIKVGILEDDPIMRNRFVAIMRSWDFVSEVVAFGTIPEMEAYLIKNPVDVLLADLFLGNDISIELIEKYQAIWPSGLCIVISSSSDPAKIIDALCAGAIGYLHKDDSSIEIVSAIESVIRGESQINSNIAKHVVRELRDRRMSALARDTSPAPDIILPNQTILTDREVEVINLLAKGLMNDEVGQILGITRSTVATHIRNIYKKLGVNRRVEALYEARSMGLIA
jgi:DNA-binding NarL/FixJ family response regulator